MSVLERLLSSLDTTTVIVFLLVFLLSYHWLGTTKNLPPGPRGLPVLGNMMAVAAALPNILQQMKKWRKQYGDIFTIRMGSKYMVVISSYKLLHETFVKKGDVFSGGPSNLHTINQVIAKTGLGIIFNDGQTWRELRRVTLMAMRDFGVGKKTLEQRVQEEARAVMEVMDKSEGRPVTLRPLLSKFSCNVICSVILGERMDYDDATFKELTRLVTQGASQPMVFAPVNFLSVMRFLQSAQAVVDKLVGAFVAIDVFLEKVLQEHEKTYDPEELRDFVDVYIKTRSESGDCSHLYTARNMRRVIVDLFIAGTETSSTTVDWLIFYMVAHPQVQTRCRQDIHKVVGQDRLVTMEDRKNLPYVEAVITELLRLVPIAPLGLPHLAVKEAEVAGYTLPADTLVVPNITEIHHDPSVWPDPDLFNPDRFLDKGGHFCPPKENFVPFSIGPRTCPGEALARMEVFILFSTLVQFFTFTMGQGQTPDLEGQMGVTFTAKLQPVVATRL